MVRVFKKIYREYFIVKTTQADLGSFWFDMQYDVVSVHMFILMWVLDTFSIMQFHHYVS